MISPLNQLIARALDKIVDTAKDSLRDSGCDVEATLTLARAEIVGLLLLHGDLQLSIRAALAACGTPPTEAGKERGLDVVREALGPVVASVVRFVIDEALANQEGGSNVRH